MSLSPERKLLVYFEEELPLVRRLGAAVISCWDSLPRDIGALLVQRSVLMLDEQDDDNLEDRLSKVIAKRSKIGAAPC